MTILVGTDFQGAAFRAADVAADIARTSSELLVLACFAGHRATAGDQARMRSEVTRLEGVCRVNGWFEEEPPSGERFAALAREMQAKLLVVGASDGLRARALGSTAAAATEHLPELPVLAVRAPAELRRSSPKVLALFALDETDSGVFDSLTLLRGAGFVDFDAVHYSVLPREHPAHHEAKQLVERQLLERLHHDALAAAAARSVMVRDAAAGIEQDVAALVHERGSSLVVCGSHHRHGLRRVLDGSVAERVLARSPVSVLISRTPETSKHVS